MFDPTDFLFYHNELGIFNLIYGVVGDEIIIRYKDTELRLKKSEGVMMPCAGKRDRRGQKMYFGQTFKDADPESYYENEIMTVTFEDGDFYADSINEESNMKLEHTNSERIEVLGFNIEFLKGKFKQQK